LIEFDRGLWIIRSKSSPVFVVDDEEDIAKMFAVVLQMNLFNAIAYSDPLLALQAAQRKPPDYLLTDVVMPGMNGVELAIQVKAVAPQCKMLIFSGQEDSERLIEKARERGYDLTLVLKPIHPTKMVELIRGL
jgi:DNA-binding NtrC family response regulator